MQGQKSESTMDPGSVPETQAASQSQVPSGCIAASGKTKQGNKKTKKTKKQKTVQFSLLSHKAVSLMWKKEAAHMPVQGQLQMSG